MKIFDLDEDSKSTKVRSKRESFIRSGSELSLNKTEDSEDENKLVKVRNKRGSFIRSGSDTNKMEDIGDEGNAKVAKMKSKRGSFIMAGGDIAKKNEDLGEEINVKPTKIRNKRGSFIRSDADLSAKKSDDVLEDIKAIRTRHKRGTFDRGGNGDKSSGSMMKRERSERGLSISGSEKSDVSDKRDVDRMARKMLRGSFMDGDDVNMDFRTPSRDHDRRDGKGARGSSKDSEKKSGKARRGTFGVDVSVSPDKTDRPSLKKGGSNFDGTYGSTVWLRYINAMRISCPFLYLYLAADTLRT